MSTEVSLKSHLIERFAVDSGTIKAIGYEGGVCVVEFQNGSLFAYPMGAEQFQQFATAESKGRYFHQSMRGKLAGTKLTGQCGECSHAPVVIGALCANCGTGIGRAVDKVHKPEE